MIKDNVRLVLRSILPRLSDGDLSEIRDEILESAGESAILPEVQLLLSEVNLTLARRQEAECPPEEVEVPVPVKAAAETEYEDEPYYPEPDFDEEGFREREEEYAQARA